MIQHLNTYTGEWLSVNQSHATPYISPGSMSAGMMRYNPNNNCVEVYDGNSWFTFSGHAEVSLTPEAQRIMAWAKDKMRQEEELAELMKKHPGLKDLYDKFELMKALVTEEAKNLQD